MLSKHSFNALLKTLEEPPPHVKFLLATTDPQRLPVTVLSRCLQFNLKRLPQSLIDDYIAQILNKEAINFEPPALTHIARAADGSMRDALSLLDQAIAYGGGRLIETDVCTMLGTIDQRHVFVLLEALVDGDGKALLEGVQTLSEQAPEFSGVLDELVSVLQRIALAQVVPDALDDSIGDRETVLGLARRISPEDVQLYYQIGLIGRRDLALAPNPRSGFEMILLRMLTFRPVITAQKAPVSEVEKTHQKVSTKSAANIQPLKSVARSAKPLVEGDDWDTIVEALNVSGMVRELATNCVLKSRDDAIIKLLLDASHAHLRNKNIEQRLEDALQHYFSLPLKLEIKGDLPVTDTPALQQTRQQQDRQSAAVKTIEADANIKELQKAFNARVITETIQPTD